MKRILMLLLALTLCMGAAGAEKMTWSLEDALGREVTIPSAERVVALSGSYADAWLLAGGALVGVTEDALSDFSLDVAGAQIVGSVKAPNLEVILSLSPDLVIMSADTTEHVALGEALDAAGVTHAYFRVDSLDDYLYMMSGFCSLTGRNDLYQQNAQAARDRADLVLARVPAEGGPKVLLLRAYSTGVKVKGRDNLAGEMLYELGADNLIERHPGLIENLSVETIVEEDPDAIFVLTMGDPDAAVATFDAMLAENGAWQGLKAVKAGRVHILPKALFHVKPNARWGESYEMMYGMLYPEDSLA